MKLLLVMIFIYFVNSKKSCGHDQLKKRVQYKNPNVRGDNHSRRFLQDAPWEPIRIYLDYTNLDKQTGQVSNSMIENIKGIMSQSIDILQNLLMVKRNTEPLIVDFCDPDVLISSEVSQQGVDADIVIFPFFDLSAEDIEASAISCNNELDGRPNAGFILIGFDGRLFGTFIDENGEQMRYDEVVTTATVNGKQVSMIKTPKVVETAQKYFNCSTLEGVELEDQGSEGTAGSHWEERIMYGDFMIGQTITENVISEISLALLEDSGWYKANYYTGGLFRYGKNKGCEFLNTKCIKNDVASSENEFPIVDGVGLTCFAGRTGKGQAFITDYTEDLPLYFQYYANEPNKGGLEWADYCPVTYPFETAGWYVGGNCWMGISQYPSALGETIGPNSYCFYSSLTSQSDSSLSAYKGKYLPICYEVTCDYIHGTYSVTVLDTSFVCDRKGGAMSVDGFDGKFYCADFNLICTKTVECGDVIDCVYKKSNPALSNYDYTAADIVNTIADPVVIDDTDPSNGFIIKHSILTIGLLLIIVYG